MIMTITLIFSTLIMVNLLLLKFSCNKTVKRVENEKKPIILNPSTSDNKISEEELAPTGS